MDYIIEAFVGAFRLILTLDREILTIALFSLQMAGTATVLATVIGVPLAYGIATRNFPGKRTVLTLFNTLMALPTVVVGLFCYAFLSRRGPLGFLDLLFTPSGMIIGDLILALPLVVALTIAAVNAVDPRVQLTARALGATSRQTSWTVLLDARYALVAAVLNGFGRVIAEVGAATMLGGNIRGYTRTLTTAIALETSKGEFAFAMALGLILLTLALIVNLLLRRLQEI
ncbi:ABC transporter permease [Candidatus Entotheonella palauensis]|uniref:ABC transporter permease n=1 Tax=Candidatus Entotheonella palauensis TaxID=93172 RepID=UPI000B7CF9EB|nr:ABC transporter permease [Candidatus Entotheonella palauensis]